MVLPHFRFATRTPSSTAGFSLVELMVALALGLIILAAMLDAFNSNSATGTTNARFADVQTNGRYAIDYMRRELHHSGYLGVQSNNWLESNCPPSPNPKCNIKWLGGTETGSYGGCGTDGVGDSYVTKIQWPIWGTNNANTLSCTGMSYLTGDVLVLRRTGLQVVGAAAATTLYVRTGMDAVTVYQGLPANNAGLPPVSCPSPQTCTRVDYPLEVDVYYVSPCTNSPCESPQVPALYRFHLGDDFPAGTTQLVATGIENMQVQYGVQATDGTITYYDAPTVESNGTWPNVVAVKIWLLARSTDAEYSGFVNKTAYVMGDQTVNPGGGSGPNIVGDNYVRQLQTLVVQLRQ